MNLKISGHHVEVTESLNDYVAEKMSRLERHAEHITSAQVTLTVEKNHQNKVEGQIHVTGADLVASAENEDMYAAIDAMIDKLDRQALKHKEKNVSRSHGQK
ncbi:MAG: ribosome hibernation-promoting factor, HPF/YfiA family [Oceanobacter sp.]